MDKVKNQEAIQALGVIYAKQMEYAKDNSGVYGNNLGNLDNIIDDTTLKHFENLDLANAGSPRQVTCGGTDYDYVASLERKGGSYYLYALKNGKIICDLGSADSCADPVCKRMGF